MPATGNTNLVGSSAAEDEKHQHPKAFGEPKTSLEPMLWKRGLGQRPPGKLLPGHDRIIPLLPLPRFRVDGGSFNACHAHGVSAVPAVREDLFAGRNDDRIAEQAAETQAVSVPAETGSGVREDRLAVERVDALLEHFHGHRGYASPLPAAVKAAASSPAARLRRFALDPVGGKQAELDYLKRGSLLVVTQHCGGMRDI